MTGSGTRISGWLAAATLCLVCLVPPALMLSPPASGEMLAVYAPGQPARETLLAAAAAGAHAAEPLAGGMLVRTDMPVSATGREGAHALRTHGALFVIAPISGWACPPGTPSSMERRS